MKRPKSKLSLAFAELHSMGYFAKQNHTCCNTCGWAEVPEGKTKVVFYHAQAADDLRKDGECYLNWSGNAKEIISVLTKHGVEATWNGEEGTKIKIKI